MLTSASRRALRNVLNHRFYGTVRLLRSQNLREGAVCETSPRASFRCLSSIGALDIVAHVGRTVASFLLLIE